MIRLTVLLGLSFSLAAMANATRPATAPATGAASRPVSTAPAASSHATSLARLDLIVFSSNRGGAWAIWSIKPDGSQPTQLSKPPEGASDVDAVVSPDGKQILFTSTRGGKAGLWKMPLTGGEPARICDGDQGEWSSDGRSIVLRRSGKIIVRDLSAGTERAVSPDGWTKCSGPSWSPLGNEIAFACLGERGNVLFIVPAAGGKVRTVYDDQGACEPHWSPDGTRLVYETESHICAINPDGTKNRPITYYGGVQRYGRFSPDGTKIVFCQAASPDGPWELYVVPARGGTPTKLTEGGSDMQPDWR